jgi:hypothetical protein
VKKTLSVSTWARSIGFALMLALAGKIHAQGIVYVAPNPQPYYSLGYPGTLDFYIDINGDGTNDFILRSNDPGNFESDVLNGLSKAKKKFQTSKNTLTDWKPGSMKKDQK